MLLILIYLLIPFISPSEIEIEILPKNTAFYTKNLGSLKIIEQQYSLVIYKDIRPLFDNLDRAQKLVNKVKLIENSLKSSYHSYVHALTLNKQLKTLNAELKTIDLMLPHLRTKRGLINGLGTLLHYAFGTMDANEDEEIQKAINSLQQSNKNMLAILDKNLHVTRDVIKDFNATIASLSLTESKIQENFDSIQKELNKNSALIHGNEFSIKLINIVTFTDEILSLILNEVQDVKMQLLYSKLNIIPPSFLRNDLLMNSLIEISKNTPEYKLPFDINDLNKFLDVATITTSLVNDTITYIIKIPLISKDDFKLYHMITLPILTSDNLHKLIIPNYPFAAVDRLRLQYIGFHGLKEVKNVHGVFFTVRPQIRHKDDGSCESDILFTQQWSRLCQTETVRIETNEMLQLEDNQWLISINKPTDFTYKCTNKDITTQSLRQHCLVMMTAPCTGMIGNNIKLSYTRISTIKRNITETTIQIPEDCCLEEPRKNEEIKLRVLSVHALNQDELLMNKHKMDRLEDDIYKEQLKPVTYITGVKWWQAALSIMIGLFALLLFCCCCCPGCLKLIKPKWPLCGNGCTKIINIQRNYSNRSPPPRYQATHLVLEGDDEPIANFHKQVTASAPALCKVPSVRFSKLLQEQDDCKMENNFEWSPSNK